MPNINGTSKWIQWLVASLWSVLLAIILFMGNSVKANDVKNTIENKEIRKEIREGDKEIREYLKEEIKEIKEEISKKLDKVDDKIKLLRLDYKTSQEKLEREQYTLGKTQMKMLTILERIEEKTD